MHNRRAKQKLNLALDESGATAIVFALTFVVICGFLGLAFDIGHMVAVRAELQRTADAGALAGATGLVPYTGAVTNQTPNWANGVTTAHTMISNAANKADNLQFTTTDGTVEYGYWLLTPPTGYVQTLPKARPTTAAYLPEPAIRVTLSRNVPVYLAPLVGVSSPETVSATATAILPEAYSTSSLPPIAVKADVVYDTVNQNMVIDATEQDIKIQSNKGLAGWFNQNGGNSVPSVRIDTPLNITNQIYFVPGTKATLSDFMKEGDTIVIPVVQDVSQGTWESISGFAAFKIDTLNANSMQGHFVNQYFDPNIVPAAGTETNYGVGGTPKLVSP